MAEGFGGVAARRCRAERGGDARGDPRTHRGEPRSQETPALAAIDEQGNRRLSVEAGDKIMR